MSFSWFLLAALALSCTCVQVQGLIGKYSRKLNADCQLTTCCGLRISTESGVECTSTDWNMSSQQLRRRAQLLQDDGKSCSSFPRIIQAQCGPYEYKDP